ncbi:NADPH:quinone reductase [Linnemannia zychae]|nr:NADPH:quinone reductase [Linnemannia zychae]
MTVSDMRAIVISKPGDVSVLEWATRPRPVPKPDQVLIKTGIVGLNYYDVIERLDGNSENKMLAQFTGPYIPGREGAGTIVEIGSEVQGNFKVGDRVAYSTIASGTYAEYVAVYGREMARLPDNVSFETGASVFVQGLTAWGLAKIVYPIKKGDWVVIHAAAGGVGLILTQLAHNMGARIIGSVSSAQKAELVKASGADHVVIVTNNDYTPLDEKVHELTNGRGADVIYDSVGKDSFESSFKNVRRLGTMVLFGFSSGFVPPFDIFRLSTKNVYLTYSNFQNHLTTREELDGQFADFLKSIEKGEVKLEISKVYPFEEVQKAHLEMETRKSTGKLLLSV